MADYFFESSAIVKRYVTERGTAWVKGLADPASGNLVHLVELTGVEVISAIARRVRGGSLTTAAAGPLCAQFRAEYAQDFHIVLLTPALISSAMDLAETHALRGSDAVQLAAALEMDGRSRALGNTLTLVSADLELNSAATDGGLTVEDPNAHP
jgi:predicted nucleic acid-binding protein